MNNQLALELYNNISQSLLDQEWIDANGFDYKSLKEQASSAAFMFNVMTLVENNNYSCQAILSICQHIMHVISQQKISEDFLNEIYQYTLKLAFPYAVTKEVSQDLVPACHLFLRILRVVARFQMTSGDDTWQSKYPLFFLTEEEENHLENSEEYRRFVSAFDNEYIYELMKLNQDVLGYNTLDHICGVHHIALYIARQLEQLGLPIDLGRVSGSAAGHDIGKYGCVGQEVKRVPYLHYYYTDLWFKKHNMPYIGHIATNHSTWDLELENLPLESLILIYADFRVKNNLDSTKQEMYIYDLASSFDVILKKLDNVDEAKEKRYKRVYAKLKDFEDYIMHIGVNVDVDLPLSSALDKIKNAVKRKNHYPLMHGKDIIESLKHLSFNHNINLMYQLRNESTLNAILELARSGNDWRELREYIRIFEEYSTYLTQKQKLITIKFLYEKLVHPEDDIRRHCAELIGSLIALFDEEYRKEVPLNAALEKPEITSMELLNKYVRLSLSPDHKIIPVHRAWIGNSISFMVYSLFLHCYKHQTDDYIELLIQFYSDKEFESEESQLYLLQAIKYIPFCSRDTKTNKETRFCNSDTINIFFNYIKNILDNQSTVLRVSALEAIKYILSKNRENGAFVNSLSVYFTESAMIKKHPSENLLRLKIATILNLDLAVIERYKQYCIEDYSSINDIFLKNLKASTNWIVKKAQVDLLLDHALQNPQENGFYTALHFCNLLKVSAVEAVRNRAGSALLKIAPELSLPQRNDVAVELMRALEIEGNQFAEYIPHYLGKMMMFLQPVELDELITDLIVKTKYSNSHINALIFKTVGIAIADYPTYPESFPEAEDLYKNRLVKMLGILLNGLVDYNISIKQVAFSILGKEIFGSKKLSLDFKHKIFQLIAKKILILPTDDRNEELLFLTNSAGLNNIYRFLSDYMFFKGEINLALPQRIAFFPGTFDPFSLSHKEIVKAIRDLNFEVYLTVDEFSWSKRTLPNLLRRNIINMSVADELDVYLYPEDFPVNLANPADLNTLKKSLKGIEVYIVIGSDVVLNASSYLSEPRENSIHSFPHVIFERRNSINSISNENEFKKALTKINNDIIQLTLEPEFEDISSTQIRNYIDENRDISMLIDPLAQKYIYENGFYQREPQYKTLIQPMSIHIEIIQDISSSLIDELIPLLYDQYPDIEQSFKVFLDKPSRRFTIIRDNNQNGTILGFVAFHRIHSSVLYEEFKDTKTTRFIRNDAIGKMLLIDGVFAINPAELGDIEQILLTETLAFALVRDYDYAIFKSMIKDYPVDSLIDKMKLMGFESIPTEDDAIQVLATKTSTPNTLNLDIETIIKEPFRSNENVKKVIKATRKKLQNAITALYPGQLILPFDRNIMYETLIKKICKENNVPSKIVTPRQLGSAICVPYGAILNKRIVPNTVTKSLHTEKLFNPDMKGYEIGAFPYYLDLENQMKMIRSFDRPIILVDDLLDKGYRIKVLDTLLKKENIKVQKIIVGYLSGRGKELMEIQNREVDCAYFIPKLKEWFNEADLYPFIGGDALWRGISPEKNMLPSVNLILPYTSPTMIKGAANKSIYNLSEAIIENALDILTTLENEYQAIHERKLTLQNMGQIITVPRCPDLGCNVKYDFNRSPSLYLKNDLEQLKRLEFTINR